MSDYIKREDAIRAYAEILKSDKDTKLIAEMILADVPSADVVEVVRCKDCKWWKAKPYADELDNWDNGWCGWKNDDRDCHICGNENDYCSYGERKDDE